MNRGRSVKDEVAVLDNEMTLLRDNVRVTEDNGRGAINVSRYITSLTDLGKVHKGTRQPNSPKRIMLRFRCSKMHGRSIEENKSSMIRRSGRYEANAVSGVSMCRKIARQKLVRKRKGFRNGVDKEKSRPDFSSDLKNDSFFRSKSRKKQSAVVPFFTNDIDSSRKFKCGRLQRMQSSFPSSFNRLIRSMRAFSCSPEASPARLGGAR